MDDWTIRYDAVEDTSMLYDWIKGAICVWIGICIVVISQPAISRAFLASSYIYIHTIFCITLDIATVLSSAEDVWIILMKV